MFKHLCAYRLAGWSLSAAELAPKLLPLAFAPCGQLDMESTGWTPPRDGGDYVHAVQGKLLLRLTTETKILPGSVIARMAAERAAVIEKEQGFKPGRKQIKEIKEQITDELLPTALRKQVHTRVLIDPAAGWFIVDTTSAGRADQVTRVLLKTLESLPIVSLRTHTSPMFAMTNWLAEDEAPAGFTVDRDADLRSTGQEKSTVKYRNQTLEVDDIRRHIAAGKQCVSLALTWSDRISFILSENLMLKRVAPLDVLKDSPNELQNEAERFDAELLLMAGEYTKLLDDVVEALGGYEQKAAA